MSGRQMREVLECLAGLGESLSSNRADWMLGTTRGQPKWCPTKFVTIGDRHREDKVTNLISLPTPPTEMEA